MIKLKEIIAQLDPMVYQTIEVDLSKNKATNSLFLLTGLRNNTYSEKEISESLSLSNNAYYALKSRLLDKIQEHLPGIATANKEELITTLSKIPEICTQNPRETANAILQKLEIDLIEQGMHNELLSVYSALKKINFHSNKYFGYSQQYNKQLAFMVSREKSDEISCEFSKLISNYILSKDAKTLDALKFLINKIDNGYELNKSRLSLLAKNIVHLQFNLFCSPKDEFDILSTLEQCDEIITELNVDNWSKSYRIFVDFLYFEYYFGLNKMKSAEVYYLKVYENVETLLLNNFIGCSISFLSTALNFCYAINKKELLVKPSSVILFDNADVDSVIAIRYYEAILEYKNGETKKARQILQKTINDYSMVNYFRAEIELKICLSYFLILEKDFEMADDYLKKILRKIKAQGQQVFSHIEYLIKALSIEINKDGNVKNSNKKQEAYTIFKASNVGEKEILRPLIPILNEKFNL